MSCFDGTDAIISSAPLSVCVVCTYLRSKKYHKGFAYLLLSLCLMLLSPPLSLFHTLGTSHSNSLPPTYLPTYLLRHTQIQQRQEQEETHSNKFNFSHTDAPTQPTHWHCPRFSVHHTYMLSSPRSRYSL